jgi:hypothetical protein
MRWRKWTWKADVWTHQSFGVFAVRDCDMTRAEWAQSVPKQQQTTATAKQTKHTLWRWSWHVSTGGSRTRTDACRWLNPTATMLQQGTKRTASLTDGCRDSDNASRRVEALGVPALQDGGGKGTFIGGNHRWGGGSIRIQSRPRGL